jgi:hypothetical protein
VILPSKSWFLPVFVPCAGVCSWRDVGCLHIILGRVCIWVCWWFPLCRDDVESVTSHGRISIFLFDHVCQIFIKHCAVFSNWLSQKFCLSIPIFL